MILGRQRNDSNQALILFLNGPNQTGLVLNVFFISGKFLCVDI